MTMRYRLCGLLFLVILGSEATAFAQAREDRQAWLSAQAEADLPARFGVAVTQELRVGSEAGFDETHTDLELDYRLSKHLAAAAHYRFIALDGETRHRVAGDLLARLRVERLALSYRLRLQATTQENDDTLVPVRNRFKVGIDLAHGLEPFTALELFYLLSPRGEYRETRFSVGLDWSATARLDLTAYLMILRETNVPTPEEYEVLGLGMSYRFWGPEHSAEPAQPGDRHSLDE